MRQQAGSLTRTRGTITLTGTRVAGQRRVYPYLRDHNATVAYDLQPLFEAETTAWNDVRRLHVSNETLTDYLSDWRRQVNPDDRPFVNRVIGAIL